MSQIPPPSSDYPPPGSVPPTPPAPPAPPPPQTLGYGVPGLPPGGFSWSDFVQFRTMIAIPVIMVLFWVGVVAAIFSGFAQMFSGHGAAGVCTGIATIIFGPFFVRLYCEFLIVVFRINETLTEILNTLRGRPPMA